MLPVTFALLLSVAGLPGDIFQDRNGDGVIDYVNAKIYVADNPTPAELRGAANVAARLAFETLSLDLPNGFPISSYSSADPSVAIVIGSAASRFVKNGSARIFETIDGKRQRGPAI